MGNMKHSQTLAPSPRKGSARIAGESLLCCKSYQEPPPNSLFYRFPPPFSRPHGSMSSPFTFRPSRGRPTARGGRINPLWMLLSGAAGLVCVLLAMLLLGNPSRPEAKSLTLYCAAGLRYPVEKIAAQFEEEYGVQVQIQFGGSNTLLNQLAVNKFETADLYLAADDFYVDKAVELGLAAEILDVAYQRPVIAVRKGNSQGIASIHDLLRDDVSVAMASPEQAAVGKAVRAALSKVSAGDGNLWEQLNDHVTDHGVFKATVNDVAADVTIGAVDAGIVWDSTVYMPDLRDELIAIETGELATEPNLVSIAVLHSSRNPTSALKFARYLTARDKGLPVFEEFGTRPVEGDRWAEHPEVTFFCGAVNHDAVKSIVAQFEAREGVTINTVYNGCGILTANMKAIAGQSTAAGFPDIYMACDVYYLENVRPWFEDAVNVSDTEIVMVVPKGSTKVSELSDLLKPGVRVAIGNPDDCTIGALSRRLLAREGLYDQLLEKQQQAGEVVVMKTSSANLVPDITTGNADVALAYITDVRESRERVDVIHIDSPLNQAIQPLSIARSSEHKHLIGRLHRRIAAARDSFEAAGFHYRLDSTTAAHE